MVALPELKDSTLDFEGGVAVLTFKRDDIRNALTGSNLIPDLLSVFDWCNVNPDVAALILTGEGKSFSAGGNIKEMYKGEGIYTGTPSEIARKYRETIQRLPIEMEKLEVPTIAAINGAAIGAGLDLANMCDLRLISNKAVVGETFNNLGLIPGDAGSWFLQRAVGYQRAVEMTLTGRIVDAAECLKIGLVLEVCEPEELLERAKKLAGYMAKKPRQALRFTKRLLKLSQNGDVNLPSFLDICGQFQGICHNTEEYKTAVKNFVEKKK
ncbi:MAG: enoyl-CoA hydratase-related protein [Alphaproteobacteria bacterium]